MPDPQELKSRLSAAQRDAVLQLGDPEAGEPRFPADLIEELLDLKVIYKRPDGSIDLTDDGWDLYELIG